MCGVLGNWQLPWRILLSVFFNVQKSRRHLRWAAGGQNTRARSSGATGYWTFFLLSLVVEFLSGSQEPGWSSIILFSLEICYSGARRREGTFQSYRRRLLTMLSNAPKRMMRMRAPTMTVSACWIWMASDGVIVFLHGAVSNCPCQTVIQVDWRGKEVFTLGLK